MPRKKQRKRTAQEHALFIFEIKTWEPHYSFSINRVSDEEDYSEYAELHLDTVCVYPDALAGREAKVIASSRRGMCDPPNPRRDSDEKPKDVGLLTLPPSGGSFYAGVPHDTMTYLLSGLAGRYFRYVMLAGPPLSRGHSLCTEFYFTHAPD